MTYFFVFNIDNRSSLWQCSHWHSWRSRYTVKVMFSLASTVTLRRERWTQTLTTITGRQLTPTKYLNAEESQKPWRKCTSVRSPYMRGKICHKTEFEDGSVSFSEAFDPDDPSLIDRHPEYNTDTDLGDIPSTPTQQREDRYKLKASRKKSNLSVIPD